MMRTLSRTAIVLVLGLFTLGGRTGVVLAQAPSVVSDKATVTIPFEFLTLDTRFPAGQYSISRIGPTHFFVRNEKAHLAAQVFTIPDKAIAEEDKEPELVFVEREGKNYLVGIITSDGGQRVTGLYGATLKSGDVRKKIALTNSD